MNWINRLLWLTSGAAIITIFTCSRNKKPDPTVQQWSNRLIEHIEQDNMSEALSRFNELIESGLTAQHAFEVVVAS